MLSTRHIQLIGFFIACFCINISAQTDQQKTQKKERNCGCPYDNIELDESFYNEPLFTADEKPSFIGGNSALYNYINRLIQNPAKNANDSLKYNVFCVFIVERDGSISHPEIAHKSDSIFNAETIRLVSTMPKWIPGKLEGKPIRCWHSISLFFGYP